MRITKDIARHVAYVIADKKYENSEKELSLMIRKWSSKMVHKYIPKELFVESNQISDRVRATTTCNVGFMRDGECGYNMTIYSDIDDHIIGLNYMIDLSKKEWDVGKALNNKYDDLQKIHNKFKDNIENTLYELKTSAKVQQYFPEAYPYLPSHIDPKSLPSPVIASLRMAVKNIG